MSTIQTVQMQWTLIGYLLFLVSGLLLKPIYFQKGSWKRYIAKLHIVLFLIICSVALFLLVILDE